MQKIKRFLCLGAAQLLAGSFIALILAVGVAHYYIYEGIQYVKKSI